jgi:two-component system, OmpR family, phosphate regulon sensor histidine kinase PhoR
MKIKWQVTGLFVLVNVLSLLLFWLGLQAHSGLVLQVDFVTVILAIILPLGIVLILASRFGERVQKLYTTAKDISKGEFDTVYLQESSDEIGKLSNEIINLGQQVKGNILRNKQEAQKIQAILTGMQEGVVSLDHVGRIVLVNHAAEKIFNSSLEQVKNQYLSELCKFEELDNLVTRALEESLPGSTELIINQKMIIRAHVSPIFGEINRPRGAVIVCYDVTELRRLEQVRTEFVGNVSHELRTPLTSIKGFAETLLDGAAEDPNLRNRFLKIIQSETLRLQRLVDDLLTLSRIENRRADQDGVHSKIQEAYEKIKPVIEPYAEAKGLSLEVKLDHDLPAVAIGIDLLSQVLLNFMENAVKYTTHGKVWLHGHKAGKFIHLEFGDTGCGIPKEDLPRIFERFYRVDKARSREQGGSGLGLSIVKHIVEGSKGLIGVSSQLGSGTVFTCELPIANGEEKHAEEI